MAETLADPGLPPGWRAELEASAARTMEVVDRRGAGVRALRACRRTGAQRRSRRGTGPTTAVDGPTASVAAAARIWSTVTDR